MAHDEKISWKEKAGYGIGDAAANFIFQAMLVFQLAFYTPYKMVAYEVWNAVRQKRPAPTPNYAEAQRTRITVGVTPVRGSKNAFSDLILKRDGKAVASVARSPVEGGMRFTYDYPAWTPAADVTLDMVGKTRTISCTIGKDVLSHMR
jgi:hypothetical protein